MLGTTLTIGWVRDLPRLKRDVQVRALIAYGVDDREVVVDGRRIGDRKREGMEFLTRKLREGDTLAVVRLRTLYAPHGRQSPRKTLFAMLHAIEDRGIEIVEIATGRRSSNARERDDMISDALDEIARSAQGRDGGRPKREFSDVERDLVLRHWTSNKHATNAEAVAAMLAEAKAKGLLSLLTLDTPQAITNFFGASGRARVKVQRARKRSKR